MGWGLLAKAGIAIGKRILGASLHTGAFGTASTADVAESVASRIGVRASVAFVGGLAIGNHDVRDALYGLLKAIAQAVA